MTAVTDRKTLTTVVANCESGSLDGLNDYLLQDVIIVDRDSNLGSKVDAPLKISAITLSNSKCDLIPFLYKIQGEVITIYTPLTKFHVCVNGLLNDIDLASTATSKSKYKRAFTD